MPPSNRVPTVVLVRDLIFATKISATARAMEAPVRMLRDPALLTTATEARLIVDLNLPGAVEAAAAWKHRTGGEVTGFVSHVDGPTILAARAAGLDRIMPRSQFVIALEELLAGQIDGERV